MNEKGQHNTKYLLPVISGVIGFFLGVLGNLVAAWIEQELGNAFKPDRVVLILGLAILGILVGAWLELRGRNQTHPEDLARTSELNRALEKVTSHNLDDRISAAKWLEANPKRSALHVLSQQLWYEVDPEALHWIALAIGRIGGEEAKRTLNDFAQGFGDEMDPFTRLTISDALSLVEHNKAPLYYRFKEAMHKVSERWHKFRLHLLEIRKKRNKDAPL